MFLFCSYERASLKTTTTTTASQCVFVALVQFFCLLIFPQSITYINDMKLNKKQKNKSNLLGLLFNSAQKCSLSLSLSFASYYFMLICLLIELHIWKQKFKILLLLMFFFGFFLFTGQNILSLLKRKTCSISITVSAIKSKHDNVLLLLNMEKFT